MSDEDFAFIDDNGPTALPFDASPHASPTPVEDAFGDAPVTRAMKADVYLPPALLAPEAPKHIDRHLSLSSAAGATAVDSAVDDFSVELDAMGDMAALLQSTVVSWSKQHPGLASPLAPANTPVAPPAAVPADVFALLAPVAPSSQGAPPQFPPRCGLPAPPPPAVRRQLQFQAVGSTPAVVAAVRHGFEQHGCAVVDNAAVDGKLVCTFANGGKLVVRLFESAASVHVVSFGQARSVAPRLLRSVFEGVRAAATRAGLVK